MARKPQPLAPVKEETEEHDLGRFEGEDATPETKTKSRIFFSLNAKPPSGPGPAGEKSIS